jgi:hypothetical protein
MTALTWTPIDGGLAIKGRIDENAELDRLADELPLDAKVIDLADLVRINSIGVREWMDFAAGIQARDITLVRCAPAFVEQMNAIANFTGGLRIRSVLTAFECEDDGDVVHVEVQTDAARRGELPKAPPCPGCGATTVPAVEDELYYRFLRYTK